MCLCLNPTVHSIGDGRNEGSLLFAWVSLASQSHCGRRTSLQKYLYLRWLSNAIPLFAWASMCRTSKPTVASHTRGLSCVCTLTEPLLGNHGHVHKLTVRRFTVQISDPSTHPPSLTLSILCRCAAGGRRSRSCSSRPVHPSMPPLRVSGAGLLHRPPLSSTLRTLIHTPERRSYLQQHTHTSKHTHTHTHTH